MIKKKYILAIVCIFICGLALWARWRPAQRFEITTDVDNVFKVVTWNVGYFSPVENKNMKDLDLDEVSTILAEVSAEVVILQELGSFEQANLIASKLGEQWRAYSVHTGHGTQVLSVLSAFPMIDEETVLCGGRYTKGVTLQTASGQSVYVLGVHAPHPARGISENLESIRCSIEHLKSRDEAVRVVAGDLNYNFDSGSSSSNDLYEEILVALGDGTVQIGETYYAHTRIDHVFHYPKDLQVLEDGSGMVDLRLRFAGVPGFRDHRPIVVSYQLD